MDFTGVGGTLAIIITALVAGGSGYKLVEKILDLWATGDARTSQSWREYAEKLEGRLEIAEAKIDNLDHELEAERKVRASQEEECGRRLRDVWKHVSRLEKIIRDAGLTLPTDTPPVGLDVRQVNGAPIRGGGP